MSHGEQPPLNYDKVRAELADRGYLGGTVGRFVLQGWSARDRSARPRLLRTAFKAALLGAPVLALLVAATVARDHRPLIATRDFPLLWLYFSPLCAVVLLILDASVGWLSGQLTHRFGIRGGEVTRATLLAGVPTIAYLVWLGRAGRATHGFALEVAFLALGVLVVVFVSWLAGLVSVAGILGRTGEVAGRRKRSLRTLFIVVPIAMLVLTVVQLGWGTEDPEEAWPEIAAAERPRMLFVGIDGIDGDWVEALEPSGAVDHLLGLMTRSSVAPLRHASRAEPAEVWMSMMTGMPGEAHGIRGAGAERFVGVATPLRSATGRLPWIAALKFLVPSRTVPTTGAERRIRTAWEIVGHERRTLSVGWWGTWPATGGGDGEAPWVVSDRVLAKLISGASFDRDAWPEAVYTRLESNFEATTRRLKADFEATVAPAAGEMRDLAWESFLIDGFHADSVAALWDEAAIENAFVYLPGLDILRYRVEHMEKNVPLLQKANLFESYTRWIDREIDRLITLVGEEATVLIVSDPGRSASPDAEGFVIARAADLPAGCVDAPLDARMAAPLSLLLSGLPSSAEMPAVVPGVCLQRLIGTSSPSIPTYGRRKVGVGEAVSEYDEEMVERLRSLGYLN